MATIILLSVFLAACLMALRFAVDSRDGFLAVRHDLVDATPGAPVRASNRPLEATSNATEVRHLVWGEPILAPGIPRFPVLAAIDKTRDPGAVPFASDPDAEFLESRARALTSAHWSDTAWLTGQIDKARFDRVCQELDCERAARQASVVQVIVEPVAPAPIPR